VVKCINFYSSIESINKGKKYSYKEYGKKKFILFKWLNYLNIKPSYPYDPFINNVLFNKRLLLHAYQSEYARKFFS
jgi:hypothetical protein